MVDHATDSESRGEASLSAVAKEPNLSRPEAEAQILPAEAGSSTRNNNCQKEKQRDEAPATHSNLAPPPPPPADADAAAAPPPLIRKQTRVGLFVFSALYTTFIAGAFFGWGPMQLLLEEDGAFHSKCVNVNGGDEQNITADEQQEVTRIICSDQTSSLLNVHLVATLMFLFAPLLGELADRFGPFLLMKLLAGTASIGITLLIVSSATQTDWLLYIGFLAISTSVISTSVIIVSTGMVYRSESTRRRVISALNSLFDAGSITYLCLWAIGEATSASLEMIASGYLAFAVVCLGGALYFWWSVKKQKDVLAGDAVAPAAANTESTFVATSESEAADSSRWVDGESGTMNTAGVVVQASNPEKAIKGPMMSDMSTTEDAVEEETESSPESAVQLCNDNNNSSDYVRIDCRPPLQQLISGQFILLMIFFAFHTGRNMFTLTTARGFLAYLGDDEYNNKYLTIFTLLMPASVLGLPFVDVALALYGYHAGLQLINILAIVHGTIQVSTSNLNVQVLGFIVFSFYRSFLFSVVFSFLPVFLGANVVGKAAGVLICVAGAWSFVNIPLANLAIKVFNGNFFWPNLFYTVMVLPMIFVAWRIGRGIEKEGQSILSS